MSTDVIRITGSPEDPAPVWVSDGSAMTAKVQDIARELPIYHSRSIDTSGYLE